MSGYIDDLTIHRRVLDEGAEIIRKPFEPDVLARKLRAVLDGPGTH